MIKIEPPNENYKKFFDKFKEIDEIKIEDWSVSHVLAYFVKKYKEYYNVDYKFKYNSPAPSKSFEIFQIKKLTINLTAKPILLKNYIDWIFKTKFPQAKRKITSISFLNKEEFVNFYKMNFLFVEILPLIDRTTPVQDKYKSFFHSINYQIETYGDLSFLYKINSKSNELLKAFEQVQNMGLDLSVLEKVV